MTDTASPSSCLAVGLGLALTFHLCGNIPYIVSNAKFGVLKTFNFERNPKALWFNHCRTIVKAVRSGLTPISVFDGLAVLGTVLEPAKRPVVSMSSPSKMAAPLPARPFGASKRKFEDFTEADKSLKSELTREISKSREKLKPKMGYDAEYFAKIADRSGLELQRLTLVRKQSRQAFFEEHGPDADWASSDKASKLDEEEQSLTLRKKLFEEQADTRKTKAGDTSNTLRRYFMQLYTSSQRGLGISPNIATMGQRDNSVQENFRNNLIQAWGSAHENETKAQLWCPVMGGYVQRECARAAHIFPYANGQEAMTSIFGEIDESKPEINEIRNGLILSMWAEKRISDGDIVIIPLVSDNTSKEEISKWAASDLKEYMIRIVKMRSTDRTLWLQCDNAQRRWGELDGAQVQFKSDHGPRSRYLFWQYCQTTLRQS